MPVRKKKVRIKRNFEENQFSSINKVLCKIYQFGRIFKSSSDMNKLGNNLYCGRIKNNKNKESKDG
jgi:hypothetical protein